MAWVCRSSENELPRSTWTPGSLARNHNGGCSQGLHSSSLPIFVARPGCARPYTPKHAYLFRRMHRHCLKLSVIQAPWTQISVLTVGQAGQTALECNSSDCDSTSSRGGLL